MTGGAEILTFDPKTGDQPEIQYQVISAGLQDFKWLKKDKRPK